MKRRLKKSKSRALRLTSLYSGKSEIETQVYFNDANVRLEVKASQISLAGLGVYACQDIQKDTLITIYSGELKANDEGGNQDYAMLLNSRYYIDASSTPRCIGGMINDAYGTELLVNCYSRRIKKDIIGIFALSDISTAQELFLSYGDAYWKSRLSS